MLAAELGPTSCHNADIAAIGRSEVAWPCSAIGTWTRAVVPDKTAKLWTTAKIAPLDCGPKKPEPGQQMPQLWPRKLRCIAFVEVLMKLTERYKPKWLNPQTWGLARWMRRR